MSSSSDDDENDFGEYVQHQQQYQSQAPPSDFPSGLGAPSKPLDASHAILKSTLDDTPSLPTEISTEPSPSTSHLFQTELTESNSTHHNPPQQYAHLQDPTTQNPVASSPSSALSPRTNSSLSSNKALELENKKHKNKMNKDFQTLMRRRAKLQNQTLRGSGMHYAPHSSLLIGGTVDPGLGSRQDLFVNPDGLNSSRTLAKPSSAAPQSTFVAQEGDSKAIPFQSPTATLFRKQKLEQQRTLKQYSHLIDSVMTSNSVNNNDPRISMLYHQLRTNQSTSYELDQAIVLNHAMDVSNRIQMGKPLGSGVVSDHVSAASSPSNPDLLDPNRRKSNMTISKKRAMATMKRVSGFSADNLFVEGPDGEGGNDDVVNSRPDSDTIPPSTITDESPNEQPQNLPIKKRTGTLATIRRSLYDEECIDTLDSVARSSRAAQYIKDALAGRDTLHRRPWSIFFFDIQHSSFFITMVICAFVLHITLAFLEPPSYSVKVDTKSFYHSPLFLGFTPLLMIEILCCGIYWIDLFLSLLHTWPATYFEKKSNKINFFALALVSLDTLLASFLPSLFSFRFSRFLRPFLFLGRHEAVNTVTDALLACLPSLSDLFFILSFFIASFAVLGVQLFFDFYPDEGSPADRSLANANTEASGTIHNIVTRRLNLFGGAGFNSFGQATLTLFVLLTTENYPTVIHQAIKNGTWFSLLFFIIFLLLAVYWLLNSLIAGVVKSFKDTKLKRVFRNRISERRALLAAFQLLDENNDGYLSIQEWTNLLSILSPHLETELVRLLFHTIDYDKNGSIDALEFFELCDICLLRFEPLSGYTPSIESWVNWCNDNLPRAKFKSITKSKLFISFMFLLNILNAIAIVTLSGRQQAALDILQWVFLGFFLIEFTVRFIGQGAISLWRKKWHRFEFLVGFLVPFIVEILLLISPLTDLHIMIPRLLRAVSCIRVFRLISSIRRLRKVVINIISVFYSMTGVGILLIALLYSYAIVGMEAFSPSTLIDYDPYVFETNTTKLALVDRNISIAYQYSQNVTSPIPVSDSFSNFPFSILTLFGLFIGNDWQQIMYYFSYATTGLASWYFISFYFIVVILIVNLVMAIIIESFIANSSSETSKENSFLLAFKPTSNELEFGDYDSDDDDSGGEERNTHIEMKQYRVQQRRRSWTEQVYRNDPKYLPQQLEHLTETAGYDLLALQREKEILGLVSPNHGDIFQQIKDQAGQEPSTPHQPRVLVSGVNESSPWLLGSTPDSVKLNDSVPYMQSGYMERESTENFLPSVDNVVVPHLDTPKVNNDSNSQIKGEPEEFALPGSQMSEDSASRNNASQENTHLVQSHGYEILNPVQTIKMSNAQALLFDKPGNIVSPVVLGSKVFTNKGPAPTPPGKKGGASRVKESSKGSHISNPSKPPSGVSAPPPLMQKSPVPADSKHPSSAPQAVPKLQQTPQPPLDRVKSSQQPPPSPKAVHQRVQQNFATRYSGSRLSRALATGDIDDSNPPPPPPENVKLPSKCPQCKATQQYLQIQTVSPGPARFRCSKCEFIFRV